MLRQIILDTETTGLEPKKGHRIIEVGCLEMINRRITDNHFHRYINPERGIDQGAVEVHGLTNEFLADKPLFADIAQELAQYLHGAELIIHNAPFDIGFLNHEYNMLRQKPVTDYCEVIDTLVMARHKHPGQRNSLDALCQRYSVDNSNRDLHGALIDAELLAQVYLLMTGGQTQLFESAQSANTNSNTESTIKRMTADRDPLPIIKANAAELAEHQKYLEMLQK